MPRKYTTRNKSLKQSKKGGPKSSRMTSPLTARLGQEVTTGVDYAHMPRVTSPAQLQAAVNPSIGVPTPSQPAPNSDMDLVQLNIAYRDLEVANNLRAERIKLQGSLAELDPSAPQYHNTIHQLVSNFDQYINVVRHIRLIIGT